MCCVFHVACEVRCTVIVAVVGDGVVAQMHVVQMCSICVLMAGFIVRKDAKIGLCGMRDHVL